ncbi:MAG: site-specific DNA-methyltransferase [Alphaproteobacteria bacterium GM7ARS4]|nr:site-specific DNA-methyltransferase [Alphaproteobacteria bacterium GM7ARS4]
MGQRCIIRHGDCLDILPEYKDGMFHLIYIDPPFNTGKRQRRQRMAVAQDMHGTRHGYGGKRYHVTDIDSPSYDDYFDDFMAFIKPRLIEAYRLLAPDGALFFHIDYREAHYCKVLLDDIFGRQSFMNEIIWAYDYGGRSKTRWSAKHDTIFWYVKNPRCYTYRYDDIDRIPYMAPSLVGKEKAARGKTPTDVWWNTIVPTNGREKTNYPTQKPVAILERIVRVHSNPGDMVLDFFAGSGTTGEAAIRHGRHAVLIDSNHDAITIMKKRLERAATTMRETPL